MGPTVKSFEPRDYSEFLAFAEQEVVEAEDTSRRIGREYFFGTSSFEEAMDLARKGWTAGAARVEALYNRMYRAVGEKVKKTAIEYGVSGSVVDVGRFCSGEPECFMEFTEQVVDGPGRILTITVNLFLSCGIDDQTVFLRGAGVMTLVDALEEAGYSVAINGRLFVKNKNRHTEDFLFPIKRPGEAVESDRLAFIMCHPAFFRRLLFSVGEHLKPFRDHVGYHDSSYYGCPVYPDMDLPPSDTTIYLKSLDYGMEDFKSEATVTAWVLKQLEAQGIETEGA